MKKYFAFSLKGSDWWRPFLAFWVIYAALYTLTLFLPRWVPVTTHSAAYTLLLLVLVLAQILDQVIFLIIWLRILVPKLSIDGKRFEFRGSVGTFVGITIVGTLLSIITATVYAPWFARRVVSYLVSETTFDGTAPEFRSRGGKLFVYLVLAVWLPVGIVTGLSLLVIGTSVGHGAPASSGSITAVTYLVILAMFILMVPSFYLINRWYVNIRWNDTAITWQTRFWPSVGFILGQVLLTMITVGIYWPAALLRLYRYFAGRTVLHVGGQETGRLGFDASVGKGFGLIWGQTLLSIITAGIYLPWAVAKVYGWLLGSSYVESSNEAPG